MSTNSNHDNAWSISGPQVLRFLVLLSVDTGSKNHGRTMTCLVVNDVERRDRRRAASLTGLRLAWSKGLQTLASSIRHGTWSL